MDKYSYIMRNLVEVIVPIGLILGSIGLAGFTLTLFYTFFMQFALGYNMGLHQSSYGENPLSGPCRIILKIGLDKSIAHTLTIRNDFGLQSIFPTSTLEGEKMKNISGGDYYFK